jgi:hypothetical protein
MMKPYVDSPATEEIRHNYLRFTNLTVLRESLIKKLFPNSDGTLSSVALKDLSLPISPNKVLSEKKIASIRMKINMFVSGNLIGGLGNQLFILIIWSSVYSRKYKKLSFN